MRKEDERLPGAMRIFEALSSVDEELLERSEEQEKVVPFWRYAKVMAACACFVVLGVATFVGTQMIDTNNSASSDCAAPEMAQIADSADGDGGANEGAAAADIALGEIADAGIEPEMEEATAEEAPAEAEKTPGAKSENDVDQQIGNEYLEDGLIVESVGTLESSESQLEEQLRENELLGDYIPTEIPEGFVFADGSRFDVEGEPESISITWYKGMDYITISVSEYMEEEKLKSQLVDISKQEEVWTTFDTPIFMESDFSLGIVEACMKSVEESGDTNTPRGNFAVLYDSGVVVAFTGRGDAQTIWKLFQSIKAE